MSFSCIPPTQLVLEIPPDVQAQAWQQSSAMGGWTAYLNQLCLDTVLPWLRSEYEPDANGWQEGAALFSQWAFVNGTAITAGGHRFILIPDKSLETREFVVPQEWVDIPSWAGDYYLAVQVNPEGDWLRIWGYTTHEQLKTQATLDTSDRTYQMDAMQLIDDLSVLWVVRQLNPHELTRADLAPLPTLRSDQAETLMQQLSNPAIQQPRLALPFQQWGALLANDDWRQRLYQPASSEPRASTPPIAHLSQWLQQVFDGAWQAIDELVGVPAFALRQTATESLVRRVKRVRLPDQDVLLVVAVGTEADGRMSVRVQVFSSDRALPPTLRLSMRSHTGEVIQSVQARDDDESIQLKRFRCAPGTRFQIWIDLNETRRMEEFVS
ncbi:DUF1822 family protein [Leptolyngbya sp. FACHB-36]|uniref:DUF1822 family protein n=1 Tax=Leptolyngbya sp. FACHB-36 TaxID=2692808 RepID=UPI001681B6B7|nr:DUF1822 family protein [Leptolyngbya sp. FACHB-36]MBD2020863.1 DUF1822 family protein [Leptolyngbya sp. FACHB-36]